MSGSEDRGEDRSEDRDVRAAEYVLGTATAWEAAATRAAMREDAGLAQAVADWERRLVPLAALALPESPPADLWDRIEAVVAPHAPMRAPMRAPAGRSWTRRLLGAWAGGATAAALAMAVLLFGRPEPRPLMTVMVADRTQTAWSAQVERDGAIRLAAIAPAFAPASASGAGERPTPQDRVMQLWALPPGATAPTSLALLPRGSRAVTVAAPAVRPVPGMLIEITLEPEGGSPIGRPTGPVLFIGRLSQPGPDS